MILHIIRHGETDWNTRKQLQGRTDISLNERGRELAELTGRGMADMPIDLVISSPLKRALETARLLVGDRKIPITTDERLIEISFGAYEGLRSGEEDYEIPDRDFIYFFTSPDKYMVPPGGESICDLYNRTANFMEELVNRTELADKTVLISTHGAAKQALLNYQREFERKDFWAGGVSKNCSIATLESHRGKVRVIEDNKIFY